MESCLIIGLWVIFKDSIGSNQVIWLGRTMSKLEWENAYILKNNTRSNKIITGVHITQNTHVINVQWYTQRVVGVLKNLPIVQSNSEMGLGGFGDHMHQAHCSKQFVPRPRTLRSNQMYVFGLLPVRVSLKRTEGD